MTVNSTNTAPTVTISSPGGGTSVVHGTSIAFSGSASDTQDGNLSASLVWTSNLDGQIGTGATFSRSLTAGSHTVTARATDQGGMSATRQVDVTVTSTALPTSGNPTLTARGYKVKGVNMTDLNGAA